MRIPRGLVGLGVRAVEIECTAACRTSGRLANTHFEIYDVPSSNLDPHTDTLRDDRRFRTSG